MRISDWSSDVCSSDLRDVRLAAFDVDGTLTDGRLHYDQNGVETKTFHAHDGLGLKLLADAGIAVALVTARSSPIIAARAVELGIRLVFQGVDDKAACLRALCLEQRLQATQVAFMGDDLPRSEEHTSELQSLMR